jgi:uncharacterized protein (DUF58 family)
LDPTLIERLNQLQLSARRVVEGTTTGVHRSTLKGTSVEFRQHRFYVPGDEPKRLDWRVLGRTDRPYIKEYDEETNLRCLLLLDGSGSMGYGRIPDNKFDYASKLVASLAYLMLGQTESVGFGVVGEKLTRWLAPASGSGQLSRLIELLERTTPAGTARLGNCLHDVADRLGRRSLVVLVSDLFSDPEQVKEGLAHLRHDRHEVICMRVLHADEEEFPFTNWTRFRGLEGERSRLAEPAMVRQVYLENFKRHEQALERTFGTVGVEYQRFITRVDLIEAVSRFLHGRMRG